MDNLLPLQIPIKNGAICGVISFVFFVLCYHAGIFPYGNVNYLLFLLPIVFQIFSIKAYREDFGEGYISFGEAFGMSMRTMLYAGSIYSSFTYAYTAFVVNDGFMEMMRTAMNESAEAMKSMVSEEFHKQTKEMVPYMTAGTAVFGDLLVKVIVGLIEALVLSAIFAKKAPYSHSTSEEDNDIE